MTAPRIAYNAGLDGIRGIAVLLVILTHAGGASGAAWVGVVMFFALSGYLITRLLVAEVEATGRIDRFGFYARRAGRLLPALLAMVLIVVAINLTRGYDRAVQDGVASLLYASSWLEAGGDYLVGLNHTWSLSVEEQFYVIWPLVLTIAVARGRPRLALGIAIVVGLSSAIWRDVLWASGAPWQRYAFGPDAETDALMAGCALALISVGRSWIPKPVTIAAAVIALGVAVFSQSADIGVEATIGIPLAIAATLVLILAAVAGVLPALTWGPLVGLGVISYGVYIWGSPVFGYGWPLMTALPGPLQPVALFVLTVAISVFSYRFLELPVRSWVRSRVDARARGRALEADVEMGAMSTGVASGAPPDVT